MLKIAITCAVRNKLKAKVTDGNFKEQHSDTGSDLKVAFNKDKWFSQTKKLAWSIPQDPTILLMLAVKF